MTPSVFHAVDDQSEVLDEVGLDEDDDDETLTKTLFLGDAAERWADRWSSSREHTVTCLCPYT